MPASQPLLPANPHLPYSVLRTLLLFTVTLVLYAYLPIHMRCASTLADRYYFRIGGLPIEDSETLRGNVGCQWIEEYTLIGWAMPLWRGYLQRVGSLGTYRCAEQNLFRYFWPVEEERQSHHFLTKLPYSSALRAFMHSALQEAREVPTVLYLPRQASPGIRTYTVQ